MKNKKSILVLVLVLILTLLFPVNASAKSNKKPRISNTSITLMKGETKKLSIKNTNKKVKWTSSNKKIATVNSNGKVVAKKKGTAIIKGKINKKTYKCKVTVKDKTKELQTLDIINKKREAESLSKLTWDKNLVNVAKIRAEEASQCWSHTRPDGTAWYTVSKIIHGENLAKNYSTPTEVVNAWMASQGHKDNILRKNFKRTAIATYTTSDGVTYWCQAFGY